MEDRINIGTKDKPIWETKYIVEYIKILEDEITD